MANENISFDPYLKWLGIHTKDQPPNHYRLLGVELFEPDPDVISNAADARMLLVKTFQSGSNSALSQQILNELAAAKVCLLNARQRAAYDANLQRQVQPALPVPLPLLDLVVEPVLEPEAKGTRGVSLLLRIGAPVCGVVVGLLIVIFLFGGSGDEVVRNDPAGVEKPFHGDDDSAAAPHSDDAPDVSPPGPNDTPPPGDAPSPGADAAEDPMVDPPFDPDTPFPFVPMEVDPEPNDTPAPGSDMPTPSEVTPGVDGGDNPTDMPGGADAPTTTGQPDPPDPAPPAAAPEVPSKPSMPDEAEQRRAGELLKDELERVGDAKSIPQKAALAKQLFQQGVATTDDPAVQYLLLSKASDLAAEIRNVYGALEAVDEIAARFDVNPLEMKAKALNAVVQVRGKVPPLDPANFDIVENGLMLTEEAVLEGDLNAAESFSKSAIVGAARMRDDYLKQDVVKRTGALLDQLKKEETESDKAKRVLEADPDDKAANLTVGRWLCLVKQDWQQGLPYLVKSDDAGLAAAAEGDVNAGADPDNWLAVGECWFQEAQQAHGGSKVRLARRAAYWVERAIPVLPDYRTAEASQQLSTISTVAYPPKLDELGVVEPGNVALSSNGTHVTGAANGFYMIDGLIPDFIGPGVASDNWPCEWVINFKPVYRLRRIAIKFPEQTKHLFNISTSADGIRFIPLASRGASGWEQIVFLTRPVKAIKLQGIGHSAGPQFFVTELQAYCAPPTMSLN